jgi:uncharacterized membrane-anchored protein YhcB (DUF1043 family)
VKPTVYLGAGAAVALGVVIGVLALRLAGCQDGEQEGLLEAARRHDELKRRDELLLRHIQQKTEIVEELIAGRIRLREGVAQFRALNEEDPTTSAAVRAVWPTGTMDEAVCRQVLSWTEARLSAESSEERRRILNRLESEAHDLLAPDP